ncbi:outer membrane beta-barrel protein, partial [Crocinitomix catalasitica]|nr:outer membrane beta-barrel protein [Crocinitomix catalasitica]
KGSLEDKFEGFGAEPTSGLWDSIYDSMDGNQGSLQAVFDGHGAEPTVGLWASIETKLEERDRRRIIFWWWTGGVAAVLIVGLGLNFSGILNGDAEIISEDKSEINSNSVDNNDVPLINNEDDQSSQADVIAEDKSNLHEIVRENNIVDENEIRDPPKAESSRDELDEHHETVHEENNEIESAPLDLEKQIIQADNKLISSLALTAIEPIYMYYSANPVELTPLKDRFGKWEMGIEYDYWAHIPDPFVTKEASASPSASLLDQTESFNGISANAVPNEFYNNEPVVEGFVIKPLNLNYTVQYNFSRRWAICSGLNYSRHFYQSNYSSGLIESTKSAVNSIGIPLGVKWSFFHRPKVDIFTRLSHTAEVPFTEKRREIYYVSDYNTREVNLTKGLLLSGQLDLGMRFKLTDRMGLNTSIGGRYYYHQRANNTAPLQQENLWIGGKIGLSWKL